MDSIILNAYAKINLSLDIVGTRPDGYHLLEMIMQTIDLCDIVTLKMSDRINVICDDLCLVSEQDNIAYKAAKAFFDFAKIKGGALINIKKNIPHGAGMGGGSADAAAVLKGLCKIYDINLTIKQLCSIGVNLGADVPFCILGGAAFATGIGDKLTQVPSLPDCYIVISKPDQGINTKQAYQIFDLLNLNYHPDNKKLLTLLHEQNLKEFAKNMGNVLEQAADIDEIRYIKQKMLDLGALGSMMTGSGSAVFGIFNDEIKSTICMQTLSKQFDKTYLCKPLKQ